MTWKLRLEPGDALGRYELRFRIAAGGMGEVWEARMVGAHGFERTVALKTIRADRVDDEGRARFLDEARLAAAVGSPYVVPIYDFGEHEGVLFLAMERVSGASVRQLLEERARAGEARIAPPVALRIVADAAAGLHAAHELRDAAGWPLDLVHRDVAPANLIVTKSGVTRLIDFGVARARARMASETSEGVLRGRLRYVAPEQLSGVFDRRADLWALGLVLYELVAGVSPYHDVSDEVALAILLGRAPLAPLPDDVPDEVRAIVDRCLTRDPDGRFATALEVQVAAERALAELGGCDGHVGVAEVAAAAMAEVEQAELMASAAAEATAIARRAIASLAPAQPIARPTEALAPASDAESQSELNVVTRPEPFAPMAIDRPAWRAWQKALVVAVPLVVVAVVALSRVRAAPVAPVTAGAPASPSAAPPEPAPIAAPPEPPAAAASPPLPEPSAASTVPASAPSADEPSRPAAHAPAKTKSGHARTKPRATVPGTSPAPGVLDNPYQ